MTDWHLAWFGGKCQKTNGILMTNGLKPKNIFAKQPLNLIDKLATQSNEMSFAFTNYHTTLPLPSIKI